MGKLKWIVAALIIGGTFATYANAPVRGLPHHEQDEIGDVVAPDQFGHEVPFPFSALVSFPWATIDGVWSDISGRLQGFFTFESTSDPYCHLLKIALLDGSRNSLATGQTFANDDQKVLRATLSGPQGDIDVIVRAYHTDENPAEVVLTLGPDKNDWSGTTGTHFIIRKN